MPAAKGDIAKTIGLEVVQRGVAASTTITKGDLIAFDSNGRVAQATTSSSRDTGFGVALESKDNGSGSADDLKCKVLIAGYVYITAGGAIKPNKLVKVSTATKVVAHSKPADASATPTSAEVNAARDYYGLTFGRYIAHENEEENATDAADTDVVMCKLGGV